MKLLLALFISLSIVTELHAQTLRLSEPVATDATSETFGSQLNTLLPLVNLSALVEQSADYVGKPFQVETKISEVCQKKGCFFIAQQNQHVLRVSFKDYSFFIPTDSSGKTVLLEGELIQKEMTKNQVEHYRSDLKTDSDALKQGIVYEIVATSVKIPLTKPKA